MDTDRKHIQSFLEDFLGKKTVWVFSQHPFNILTLSLVLVFSEKYKYIT